MKFVEDRIYSIDALECMGKLMRTHPCKPAFALKDLIENRIQFMRDYRDNVLKEGQCIVFNENSLVAPPSPGSYILSRDPTEIRYWNPIRFCVVDKCP